MARKRPAKRRKQSQKSINLSEHQNHHQIQTPPDASSTILTPSCISSDDGALSENTMSDGAQTAMTSFMDTDEEASADPATANTATTSEPDSDDHNAGYDVVSMYPRGHYPQVAFEHRTEEPWRGTEVHGGSDMGASTRSLWAQDLDYREIHGRRYCRDYYMPNDDMEQLRLALLHRVYLHVLNNELTTVYLDDPEHILDIGTGTGEWAIRVAELYPNCEVVGTDISATAETQGVPMNVFFEVEDAEDWERLPDHYDLIHFRDMEGSFMDWAAMYDNVFYSLKPGGYVEIQDFDTIDGMSKFFSQFSSSSSVHALQRDIIVASEKAGRVRGVSHMNPRVLLDAGFVDVRATEYVIPITIAEKTAGKIWLIACLDAFEAVCLRLLTEHMGWDPDECKAACEEAARELANLAKDPEKSKGLQIKIVVVTARKPLDAPPALTPQAYASSSPSMRSQHENTPGRSPRKASREPSPLAIDASQSQQARERLST